MTTEILNQEKNEEIDWSTPQWVILNPDIIVFTNGEHGDKLFEGTVLPCKDYPNGEFSKLWGKINFQTNPNRRSSN
jgi:hypothetical protein